MRFVSLFVGTLLYVVFVCFLFVFFDCCFHTHLSLEEAVCEFGMVGNLALKNLCFADLLFQLMHCSFGGWLCLLLFCVLCCFCCCCFVCSLFFIFVLVFAF